jgi:hypothetical protein
LRRHVFAILMAFGLVFASATMMASASDAAVRTTYNAIQAPAHPDVVYCSAGEACTLYPGGGYIQFWDCANATYDYPDGPIGVISDHCPYRVWAHEYANNTGWTICVSPGTSYNVPSSEEIAGNIQVTENPNNC